MAWSASRIVIILSLVVISCLSVHSSISANTIKNTRSPITAQLVDSKQQDRQARESTGMPIKSRQARLSLEKLEHENRKLQLEADALQTSNEALGKKTKLLTTWLTAAGGTVVTLLLAVAGLFLNRTQRRKLRQDLSLGQQKHDLESRKMQQEKEFARENHLLELFRDLGADKPEIRVGAVAVLVQRLKKLHLSTSIDHDDEKQEFSTIVSVLISVTKHENEHEIQKYIADGLANSLRAFVPKDATPKEGTWSPLKAYDFQGARFYSAWWKRIDARGVDFYGAHLIRAGLREAFLSGSVLKRADLSEATLEKAQLTNANLQGTILRKAKLAGADLTDADLTGADLTGADLRNVIMTKAKIQGAILDMTNTDGVDFSSAIQSS